jgi:hypothetical protein
MKFLISFMMFVAMMGGCKSGEKVVEVKAPVPVVVDVPPALPPAEPNDPQGVEPVPPRSLTPDEPGAASPVDTLPAPVPEDEPVEEVKALAPGTVVKLKAGEFVIIGLYSKTVSGQGGVKTYYTIIDGIKYRIHKKGEEAVKGDYQKDPNIFATSHLPMGVDKAVESGKLTKEQIASIQMDKILELFTYQDRDGGTNRHKEMAYMLQRVIVDGYLRGVNIIPIIKAQSDKLKLGVENLPEFANEPNGVAVGEWVRYGDNFWEKNGNPFYVKLRTFYHELGHALLERGHKCVNSMMNSLCSPRPFPKGSNYEPMMAEFFNVKNWEDWKSGSRTRSMEGGATPYCPITATKAEIAKGVCPKTR